MVITSAVFHDKFTRSMIVCRTATRHALLPLSRWSFATMLMLGLILGSTPARAHSPFDSTAHVTVMEKNLEASLVVGSGLSEKLLRDSGVSAIPNTGVGMGTTLPIALATRLFEIEAAGTNLPATQVRVLSDGLESTFVVTYP